MMKTTKNKIVVLIVFLLAHLSIYAQYSGGSSDGSSSDIVSITSCSTPSHFYAYFGGDTDGSSVETILNTTCGFSNHFYAYFGGNGDGANVEDLSQTSCGFPAHFYAYFGGNDDGAGVETLNSTTCAFPPQFYAYFGGQGDGYSLDKTAPICPTQPPVASFTASTTALCVGQSVTFTDTSTNIPFVWSWTITGATPSTSTAQNPTFVFNTAGLYTVVFTATNYNGSDTATFTNYINVTAIPVVTSTTPASRCDAGTVTLGATASLGTLNWYAAASGGTSLGTGTSFITPSISTTTTYYVESASGTCSSTRIAVVATVNTTPTITATTPNSRCDAGSVVLNATSSAGSTIWYSTPTGGTPLATTNSFTTPIISTTTTYYVEASTGSCTSPRTPVIATVNTTPTITATTPASVCDSGVMTLTATASGGTVTWYNVPSGGTLLATGTSFTTPNLTSTTNYYVQTATATCTSVRTLVVATVNQTPSITSTVSSSVCDSGTVTLGASTNTGTLNWYTVASGGSPVGTGNSYTTPSLSATTTYYVESVNGSCISTRVPVIATVNATPTIISTTGATICGQGGGTLSATASAGTILWYSLATGGSAFATGTSIPVSGGSFTFYVEATNNGCTSSPRVAVTYTYIPNPNITSAGSANRCGAGNVTLTTSSDSGIITWYDAPTGGNLVATGTSFTTPSLNATTTYYVEATNGTCGSLVRTPITATISVTSPPIATANQTFCNGEIVGYIAVIPSGPSIIWYDAATGGNVVSNSSAIVSGTTYYASQTISGCESTVRTPVTMTLGGCLGNETFEANVIKLYPNPVIDFVTISSTQTMNKVEVVNMLGQHIFVKSINEIETNIDMSSYASGSYLIRVLADDNKVQTFKIIKK
jgi:PKD repeat protein